MTVKYLKLNSGYKVPRLGFGTFDPKASLDMMMNAVLCALDTGYRHLDCAATYNNESAVGAALNERIGKGINREDLFITSKLANTEHTSQRVVAACKESLKKLGLTYIDMYLIHFPISTTPYEISEDETNVKFDDVTLENTWKAMEGLVYSGLVRSIGLSNFNKKQIDRILETCNIMPAMLQIECSVNFPNTKLIEYASSRTIITTAYAPFGSPGVKITTDIPSLLDENYVKEIAIAHNRTPAQILLRHALQRNICVITKSVTPARIQSNFEALDFELSKVEMDELNSKGHNIRMFEFLSFKGHPEYPFNDDY